MEQLKKQLRSNVTANADVSIQKEAVWHLPVVSYAVSFGRVKRLKMDILMKMLLLTFQETEIRRTAALADMLFVEELFIRDVIEKMQRTQLIRLDKKGYGLTAKGTGYLEKGIFEEEMEAGEALVSFSAVHDEYRVLTDDADAKPGEARSLYRYAAKAEADEGRLHALLSEEKNEAEEGAQIIVTEITGCEERDTEFIPCIEFQLYDRRQDIFFARVWNTRNERWDEKLEKQIEEREITEWRKEAASRLTAESNE